MTVTLTWPAVTGATSYRVYRGQALGGPYVLAGVLPTTTWNDGPGNLATGINYYYVVTALNSDGESLFSNQFTATAPAFATPPVISGSVV